MENFVAYNPTKVHFGKNVVDQLGATVDLYGKKVLIIYGKGSIKTNGVYDKVMAQLQSINACIIEFAGIKANPVIEDVDAAAKLGRQHQVEAIVAVGGGSVIDSAKIISLAIANNFDGWDIMTHKVEAVTAIPLIVVLTLPATGTEMNANAVVQNHAVGEKIGFSCDISFPLHSFLDPQFTFSLPRVQIVNGIVDAMAHCFEAWFGYGDAKLSDQFTSAIICDLIRSGPLSLANPQNYDDRADMMWAATCALNYMTMHGRRSGDWGVHGLAHNLSLLYDTAHGATLSLVYPAWLKLHKDRIPERIAKLGAQIFSVTGVEETILALEKFWDLVGSPIRLQQIGIGKDKKQEIVDLMRKNKASGMVYPITGNDYDQLVELMY